jgi:hypothetical protein
MGGWRKLYDLYIFQNVIRMINSRRIRWVGNVAQIEERNGSEGK